MNNQRAKLDGEHGAAETATSKAMLMIARLQHGKAAAMMDAHVLRGLAEGRAAVSVLAASYAALLRAHGVNPRTETEMKSMQREKGETNLFKPLDCAWTVDTATKVTL
jgi:hypothetical protein